MGVDAIYNTFATGATFFLDPTGYLRLSQPDQGTDGPSGFSIGALAYFYTTRYGSRRSANNQIHGAATNPRLLGQSFEWNHLSQDAAFRRISRDDGISVLLSGSINEPGTEHFEFHLEMEKFWEPHRRNITTPTIKEYNLAANRTLRTAGATEHQAKA